MARETSQTETVLWLGEGSIMSRHQIVTAYLAIVGASIPTSLAGTIYVPADYPTIQGAIQHAGLFDLIIVAPGNYSEAINIGGKVITVRSENPSDSAIVAATIINPSQPVSVVTLTGGEDENTVLDGFTVTGGSNGIDAHRALAAIKHCVV